MCNSVCSFLDQLGCGYPDKQYKTMSKAIGRLREWIERKSEHMFLGGEDKQKVS